MPSAKDVFDYRRTFTRVLDLPYNRQELTMSLAAASALHKLPHGGCTTLRRSTQRSSTSLAGALGYQDDAIIRFRGDNPARGEGKANIGLRPEPHAAEVSHNSKTSTRNCRILDQGGFLGGFL
jgi:hypothetical protein